MTGSVCGLPVLWAGWIGSESFTSLLLLDDWLGNDGQSNFIRLTEESPFGWKDDLPSRWLFSKRSGDPLFLRGEAFGGSGSTVEAGLSLWIFEDELDFFNKAAAAWRNVEESNSFAISLMVSVAAGWRAMDCTGKRSSGNRSHKRCCYSRRGIGHWRKVKEVVVVRGTGVAVTNAVVVTVAGVTVHRGTAANGADARMSVAIKSVAIGLLDKSLVAEVARTLCPPSMSTSPGGRKSQRKKPTLKVDASPEKYVCKRLKYIQRK